MFPCSHRIVFDGMDSAKLKTTMRKIQKKKAGKNGGNKKKEIFIYVEVSILMCSPSVHTLLLPPPPPQIIIIIIISRNWKKETYTLLAPGIFFFNFVM
jgi:hypothetical protein